MTGMNEAPKRSKLTEGAKEVCRFLGASDEVEAVCDEVARVDRSTLTVDGGLLLLGAIEVDATAGRLVDVVFLGCLALANLRGARVSLT